MRKGAVLALFVLMLSQAASWAAEAPSVIPVGDKPGTISLIIESADLRAVVTALAEMQGLNVVGNDRLRGMNVTVRLENAKPREALDIILKNAGFELMERPGGIYEIVTKQQADRERQGGEVEKIRVFTLKSAEAAEVAKLLVPHAVPDATRIGIDARSRKLVITGTEEQLTKVETIIGAIDTDLPQVAIEARIVEIFNDRAKSLGTEITTRLKIDGASSTTIIDLLHDTTEALTFDMSVTSHDLDVNIEALATSRVAEVLSAPQVTTSHGRQAEIKVINQVPVITRTTKIVDQVTVTDETVEFKETGLTLIVTPRVLDKNNIEMLVEPSVKVLTGWTDTDPAAPIIDERSAKTVVTTKDGQWIVIGGLMRYNETVRERGVPWLMDIPGLGWLFRYKSRVREKSNLIIFLSASVLTDGKNIRRVNQGEQEIEKNRKDTQGPLEGAPPPEPTNGPGDKKAD